MGFRSSNLRVQTTLNQEKTRSYELSGRGQLDRFRALDTLATPWNMLNMQGAVGIVDQKSAPSLRKRNIE
jgi:hypothetical protein